jgi:hypothetical protein
VIERATLSDSVGFLWGLRFPPTLDYKSPNIVYRANYVPSWCSALNSIFFYHYSFAFFGLDLNWPKLVHGAFWLLHVTSNYSCWKWRARLSLHWLPLGSPVQTITRFPCDHVYEVTWFLSMDPRA